MILFTYRWLLIYFMCQWFFKVSLALGKHVTPPDSNGLIPVDYESMVILL